MSAQVARPFQPSLLCTGYPFSRSVPSSARLALFVPSTRLCFWSLPPIRLREPSAPTPLARLFLESPPPTHPFFPTLSRVPFCFVSISFFSLFPAGGLARPAGSTLLLSFGSSRVGGPPGERRVMGTAGSNPDWLFFSGPPAAARQRNIPERQPLLSKPAEGTHRVSARGKSDEVYGGSSSSSERLFATTTRPPFVYLAVETRPRGDRAGAPDAT